MANVSKSRTGTETVKKGSVIPYLMFANDCMIFYKANRSTTRNVKTIF